MVKEELGLDVIFSVAFYDKDAPTKVGAMQTPSFVRILCTLFVVGLTQAASLDSSVMKPRWLKFTILLYRIKTKILGIPGWIVSNIFFFGFN